jgi:hypothetical protein
VDLSAFIDKWKQSGASERANKDSFLRDLCDVLGVPHPDPATGDPERDRYTFERDAVLLKEKHTIGKIDLYKDGCFILEAKQGSQAESKKIGSARRGTAAWSVVMQEAFGQARTYADTIDPPPPFVIVADIGYCFDIYAAFDGTRNYRKFPDALSSRIFLEQLGRDMQAIDTLRTIFADPLSLDPSKRAAKVTREIAGHVAKLAKALQEAGHDPERVAKFLMRCLFTMFAEDVELLPKGIFADALKNRWIEHPEAFPTEVEDLWKHMNEGGYLFGAGKIWQFNGGLFADPTALPLTRDQLWILGYAAQSNWADVEPAIFGTLLERALDPKERHRLGAHYTPRTYVERLVKPTIEEPLRAEWDNVRAQVLSLVAAEDPDKNIKAVAEAKRIVNAFYDRLTKIRVLDPACGSGNFLYVALDLFKRIENEVIDLLDNLGEDRVSVAFSRSLSGHMVTPEQFHGIEVNEWAKWITELVLWIGWLQWQIRTRGWKSHPNEPILRDYHNIELRDAVLAYDEKVPLLDDEGKPVTRWDGETMKVHPATGEEVPDETARVPRYRYVNAKPAGWPQADFVIGNPPYIGTRRMRLTLGDGYVDALAAAYKEVPENADYVMYWWFRAAELVKSQRVRRFGLITTNSIGQIMNRSVLQAALQQGPPMSIRFVVPDHPWVETSDGAAVRVAMTVGEPGGVHGVRQTVVQEVTTPDHEVDALLSPPAMGRIGPDLRIGRSPAEALSLRSNERIAYWGVKFYGDGFIVTPDEARQLLDDGDRPLFRPFVSGRDLTSSRRDLVVIDCDGLSESELALNWPRTYQWLLTRVKPVREQNPRAFKRERWWIFGENQPGMRAAVAGLARYVASTETAKHRVFHLLLRDVLAEGTVVVIAIDDTFQMGVLSSRVHVTWALAAGGTLEDRPRYNKTVCFDPFPFPDPPALLKQRIRDLGEQLDAHRKRQQARVPDLTITAMYNVLEKLRSGEPFTAKEKKTHEEGLVSVLKQIHDDLDAAVFDAYGWPHDLDDEQLLERLVALNAERAEEEKRGIIRWLRPEFQNPAGTAAPTQVRMEIVAVSGQAAATKDLPAWPAELPQQIAAVRDLVTAKGEEPWSVERTARAFKRARRKDVESVLDSLSALGIVIAFVTPEGKRWRAAV